MDKRNVIGIDLAKTHFHAVVTDHRGKQTGRHKLSQSTMHTHFANQPPARLVMEACAGAHYWARVFQHQGHDVRLLAPQHVRPYRRGNKNDYNDALAIAEAGVRPQIREVRIKSAEQLQVQALERLRQGVVDERTGASNRIRGLLSEQGIILPKGIRVLCRAIPLILEDADNGLTIVFRACLQRAYEHLIALGEDIDYFTEQQQLHAANDEDCQRLLSVPGIGPISAIAFANHVSDPDAFKRGRDVSASLGIVPGQNSTGGRAVLTSISKRGNKRLRYLLVHGARAVARHADKKDDALSRWFCQLRDRRGYNKAVVALANKIARIGWAVLKYRTTYQPNRALVSAA